jgi:predicted ATPase
LACAAAAGLAGEFPDGIVFVDLAPLRDARLVPMTIARALDVRESGGRSARELLLEYLAARRVLLVLDNFEHLLEAAPVIAELVPRCPGLAALVTSRIALRVQGERRYAVTPLLTPGTSAAPSEPAFADWPAVQLFMERARAAAPDFEIQADQASTVAAICRRLDGMPLAIELAAARAPLLSPDALLRRLERPFPVLTTGARDLPSRQQTLRNTLAWSYDLLDPSAQSLFRRLAVFRGGWTLDAAESVASDADLAADTSLDALQALIDSSLVLPLGDAACERRFGMLETVREYAEEQLPPAEAARVFRRHAEVFTELAELAEQELRGPRQILWFESLSAELGNLRAALMWADEHNEVTLGLRLAGALSEFWEGGGFLIEGQRWLASFLDRASSTPSAARARACASAGNLARQSKDRLHAEKWLIDSTLAYQEVGDTRGVANALRLRADLAYHVGDCASARTFAQQSLELFRSVGDAWGTSRVLRRLGTVLWLEGDAAAAKPLYDQSLALAREGSDDYTIALCLHALSEVAVAQGDYDRAAVLAADSLNRTQARNAVLFAECVEVLGLAAGIRGRAERAARLFGAAEAFRETIGAARPIPDRDVELRGNPGLYNRLIAAHAPDAAARAELSAAWSSGRSMSLERAVAEALLEASPSN